MTIRISERDVRDQFDIALDQLAALAQPRRLRLFRYLVRAGAAGRPAGAIAQDLGIVPNSLSSQLNLLSEAGLIRGRRDGRSIIYAVNYEGVAHLLVYLIEDCCDGRADIRLTVQQAADRAKTRTQSLLSA
jgi:DNA-binding transcriptional ArsR family regulator